MSFLLGYLWYQVPFGGEGEYVQGIRTHPPPPDMGPGIPRDTVGKRAVRILLEYFLIQTLFWNWLTSYYLSSQTALT